MVKITQLSDTTAVKYQWIMWVTIRPHTIQIQAHRDPEKKWFPMAYKVTYEELEAVVQDWPIEWCDPVNAYVVLEDPPTDSPK